MECKERILSSVAELLKEEGFRRQRRTWYRRLDRATVIINLQGSQFGPHFYMNCGTYYERLNSQNSNVPTEDQWHLSLRSDAIIRFLRGPIAADSEGYSRFNFNLEEADCNSLVNHIVQSLREEILPFLCKLADYRYLAVAFPEQLGNLVVYFRYFDKEVYKSFFHRMANETDFDLQPHQE